MDCDCLTWRISVVTLLKILMLTVLLQLLGRSCWLVDTLFWRGQMQGLCSVPTLGFLQLWSHFTKRSSPTAGRGFVVLQLCPLSTEFDVIGFICFILVSQFSPLQSVILACQFSSLQVFEVAFVILQTVWNFYNGLIVLCEDFEEGNGCNTWRIQALRLFAVNNWGREKM